MCQGCWFEMGQPKIDNPKVRQAAALVTKLYEEQAVGGRWHIVTDDWNLEDDHVQFCADSVDHEFASSVDGELGPLLLSMTEAERGSALALHEGWWA